MDNLNIEGPLLRHTVSKVITKLCKQKFGLDPKFELNKLSVNTKSPTSDTEDQETRLSVNLSFSISKLAFSKLILDSIKED